MTADTVAQRDIVRKLARGSLLSRLGAKGRQPLRLVAVPRDHVQGDRQRGDALLAGKLIAGSESLALADLDFGAVGA
nr:heparinase [Sphingomonas sp.]